VFPKLHVQGLLVEWWRSLDN